jgi:predicted transposase/invertase (TIGR01784 family)
MQQQPPKPGRYLDPLTDFGFKHIFGSEPNKEILIAFLNDLFEGKKQIIDLSYSPTERGGDSEADKNVFFDLNCKGSDGEQFIIEMQRAAQRNFDDRVVFYLARAISGQIAKGELHGSINLKEVYLIAILEFNFIKSGSNRYLHNVSLVNTDTGEIFYNKLGYKFLELPNFVKSEAEIETNLDSWFFLLKNMSRLDKIPAFLNKRIFQKVFKIAEISKLTKEERAMYDSNLKSRLDYDNSITYAAEMAAEIAAEKAEHKKALKIAGELIKEGSSNEFIAKITELSIGEIEKLRATISK